MTKKPGTGAPRASRKKPGLAARGKSIKAEMATAHAGPAVEAGAVVGGGAGSKPARDAAASRAAVSASDLMPKDPDAVRILDERAALHARPPRSRRAAHGGDAYVQVDFGGPDRYGIPFAYASEVVAAGDITPVPGTPDHIAGVINLRGTLLTVVDPRSLLGLPAGPRGPGARIVVVAGDGLRFGVLAHRVDDRVAYEEKDLGPPIGGRAFVRGIHAGRTAVLDMEALFSAPVLIVDQAEQNP